MSHATNDPDEVIRAALRSAADLVEPHADGYEAIRARLGRPYPLPIAWLEAAWTRICLRTPDWVRFPIDRVAHELLALTEHFLPASAKHRRGRRGLRGLGWIRPVGAMAVAISIVTAVVYMAIRVPQYIAPESSLGTPSQQAGASNGIGGPSGSGHHQSVGVGSSSHPSSSPIPTLKPPTSSCSPGAKQTTAPTGSGPSSSSSPTASPSSSSSSPSPSTSTPTPTPTPSGSTGASAPSGSLDTPDPSTSDPGSASARTVRTGRATHAAVSLVSANPCGSSHVKKKPKAKSSSPTALGPIVRPSIILTGAAYVEAEVARQIFT